MEQELAERCWRLAPGVEVLDRGADIVQVGLERDRSVLLHNAPRDAAQLLGRLDGRPLAEIFGDRLATPWPQVLSELAQSGLLMDADDGPAVPSADRTAERELLAQRHGGSAVAATLTRRQDAVIEVIGDGRVAALVALLLAASYLGHVHHQPLRTPRLGEFLPVERPASDNIEQVLADRLRTQSPGLNCRRPEVGLPPNCVVLATDGPPDPMHWAEFMPRRVPHLAVWTSSARAVVGPLVLPGLSVCLHCMDLYRTERDAGWPLVAGRLRQRHPVPTAALAAGAAALAASCCLDLIDGLATPMVVDATVEWTAGILPVRRLWRRHQDCGCAR